MTTLTRKVNSSDDGKLLFLSVNNIKLASPWKESRCYLGEKAEVTIEKKEGSVLYSVKPIERKIEVLLPETNWKPLVGHA